MATSLADLTPSTRHRYVRHCLICGTVMALGWIALSFGTHLFLTGYLPGLETRLLALSAGLTILGTTLLLIGSVRAYNVLVRSY